MLIQLLNSWADACNSGYITKITESDRRRPVPGLIVEYANSNHILIRHPTTTINYINWVVIFLTREIKTRTSS